MMEFVSWDDDIPNWMESQSKFHGSSHHQSAVICYIHSKTLQTIRIVHYDPIYPLVICYIAIEHGRL